MSVPQDTKPLDEVIVGRVEPRIYAFLTSSVPRYLKVGDTYRPLPVRIAEWQKHFSIDEKHDVWDWPAVLDDGVFFRDYSVHQYLQDSRNLIRLTTETLKAIGKGKNLYFSNEFFLDARKEHVEEAIEDIKYDHGQTAGKYSFYHVKDIGRASDDELLPVPVALKLRPNQADAVDRFKEAVGAGRSNLLMYAVMRFGKTITSLQCARELNARFVVVVSGKADVAREWRNTVLGFKDFNDEYVFLSRKDLDAKYSRVTDELKAGHKVVLFATLQDLQGDAIKPRHEQIFGNPIDLLIIDETHFAARAKEYGKALRVPKEYEDADLSEEADAEEVANAVKVLNAKVRLHLSGTPYRILMGSEFQPTDIVSFCQFTDIIAAQQKWDAEHLLKGEEEWDNPYYGFPQMVRFAFNLNESARKKLEELKADGKTTGFRELFRPSSMEKDTSAKKLHRKFVHEKEVVDLIRAISGASEEPGILPFLKYEKIEKGQMCHHIVCVLPWCASCDALEALLDLRNRKYKGTFGKLGEYRVINISGKDVKQGFVKIANVVETIADCEKRGIKTLTLTVNRMLTGSTVPEWDTMLFLKDTESPQEYDQAIFRLQSSFVRDMTDENGRLIRFNMKPQTLLVDFDPTRMFRLQEARAQVYNVNTDKNGNRELERRVAHELEVSPVILFNKDKIHRIEASDVMAVISQYSSTRGVAEEVEDVPVDAEACRDPQLRALIDKLPELGSKEGLTIAPHTGEETDADVGKVEPGADDGKDSGEQPQPLPSEGSDELKSFLKRIKTYHALIVFYSFLVPERVHSLDEILHVIDRNENNRRIARHLGLEKSMLELYRNMVGWQTLQKLDYKIQNLDRLANEAQNIDLGPEYVDTPDVVRKAIVAMRKFGRLGEAKIVTPPNIAYDMVRQIPGAELKAMLTRGEKVLDPASKMGEFAIAIVRRCAEADIGLSADALKNALLSIPMCGVTYEFTRKVYELLGLDVNCIAQPEKITTYDLLTVREPQEEGRSTSARPLDCAKIKRLLTQNKNFNTISIGDDVAGEDNSMCKKIGLMISNPPYQDSTINDGDRPNPLYHLAMDAAYATARRAIFITPGRFLFNAGQTPKEWNAKMLADEHLCVPKYEPRSKDVFPGDIDIKGGVAITYRDAEKTFGSIGTFTAFTELNSIVRKVAAKEGDSTRLDSIVSSQGVFRFADALYKDHPNASEGVGTGTGNKIVSREFVTLPDIFLEMRPKGDYIEMIGRLGNERVSRFVMHSYLEQSEYLNAYKVLVPEANGTGAIGEVLSTPIIGTPMIGFTDTFIAVGPFSKKREAANCMKYVKSKFARTMLGVLKVTQHNTKSTWRYVPLQDFTASSDIDWSRSIPEIDRQLYDKYDLSAPERQFIESMIKPME